MEDAGQHDLHRTALGPDHQVDARQVAPEPGLDLGTGAQHKGHRGQTQGQQQQVQRGRQRAGPEITPGQPDHARPSARAVGARLANGLARGRLDSTSSDTSARSLSASTTRASWLAITSVQPSRSAASSSKASRCRVWSSSRLALGSSASNRRGRRINARASATRCAWPTLSWCGRRADRSAMSSASSSSAARALSARCPTASAGSARFSATVSASLRCRRWGTTPSVAPRQASSARGPRPASSVPATTSSPRCTRSSPASNASSVDLPVPEAPRNSRCRPAARPKSA
mmetsp:Transcript_5529/g.13368  ORF Transcript_5529/g.13368 Transcript_5529/m.13368 type:complete len:288 (+) Transcript_5529:256-1119(+)